MLRDYFKAERQTFVFLILVVLLLSGGANECFAGTLAEEMRRYLETQAMFEAGDFSKMDGGKMAVKSLPVEDKNEVAACGVIRVNAAPDAVFRAFQEYLSRQDGSSAAESGSFGAAPHAADLQKLTLGKKDIEDLKNCRVGDCNLRLSAAMIERFQTEIDWCAADYPQRATELFRRIIAEYARDYLARGDAALLEYADKPKIVSLRKEYAALLAELSWLNDAAPEFFKYLRDFPNSEPPNVSKSIGWSKVKFGLKPVFIITQTITYKFAENDGATQILSVTKQIYANHYFDSSIGLTALIQSPKTADSYLLYVNHSRSSSLNKFTRGIVKREGVEQLETLLQTTKSIAEFKRAAPPELSFKRKASEWLKNQNLFIWLLIVIGALLAINYLCSAIAKKSRRS